MKIPKVEEVLRNFLAKKFGTKIKKSNISDVVEFSKSALQGRSKENAALVEYFISCCDFTPIETKSGLAELAETSKVYVYYMVPG